MSGLIREDARLVEVTSLPIIYADGAARVVIEGHNVRVIYFEYRRIGSERLRMPVLEMIRPLALCGIGQLKALVLAHAAVPDGYANHH